MRWRLKNTKLDQMIEVELLHVDGERFEFLVDGVKVILTRPRSHPFSLETDELQLALEVWNSRRWRAIEGAQTFSVEPQNWMAESVGSQNEIRTQMPGRILKVLVKEGQHVKAQDTLIVMEAMKMENEIRAASAGVISKLSVQAGQSVESGALLISLEPSAA